MTGCDAASIFQLRCDFSATVACKPESEDKLFFSPTLFYVRILIAVTDMKPEQAS